VDGRRRRRKADTELKTKTPHVNVGKKTHHIPEKMENNRHFGTLFGTRIVEAKPPDTIVKNFFFGCPSNLNFLFWSTAAPHNIWKDLKMFEACNDQILNFRGHMGRTQFLKFVDVQNPVFEIC